jgi:hypothetical protein
VRATPHLADNLKAINELGELLDEYPDLGENIAAVAGFVKALQEGAGDDAPEPAAVIMRPSSAHAAPAGGPIGGVRYTDGTGLARGRPLEELETIGEFFDRVVGGDADAEDYRVEVDGVTVEEDHELADGQTVLVRKLTSAERRGAAACRR